MHRVNLPPRILESLGISFFNDLWVGNVWDYPYALDWAVMTSNRSIFAHFSKCGPVAVAIAITRDVWYTFSGNAFRQVQRDVVSGWSCIMSSHMRSHQDLFDKASERILSSPCWWCYLVFVLQRLHSPNSGLKYDEHNLGDLQSLSQRGVWQGILDPKSIPGGNICQW